MPSQVEYQPGTIEPGWRTTEFYQTIATHLIATVVVIVTAFKPGFTLDGVKAIVPSIAVAASALAQVVYSMSRTKVKVAASHAAATAATALAVPTAVPARAATVLTPAANGTAPTTRSFAAPHWVG